MVALFASTRLSPKSPPPVAGSRPNSLIQKAASNRGLFCVLRKQCAEKREQAAALPRREATVFRVFRRRRARPAQRGLQSGSCPRAIAAFFACCAGSAPKSRSRLRLCRAVKRLFFVYSAAGGQGPHSGVAICELSASNRGLFCVLRKQCAEKQPYPPHPAHAVANAHMGAYAVALGGVPP